MVIEEEFTFDETNETMDLTLTAVKGQTGMTRIARYSSAVEGSAESQIYQDTPIEVIKTNNTNCSPEDVFRSVTINEIGETGLPLSELCLKSRGIFGYVGGKADPNGSAIDNSYAREMLEYEHELNAVSEIYLRHKARTTISDADEQLRFRSARQSPPEELSVTKRWNHKRQVAVRGRGFGCGARTGVAASSNIISVELPIVKNSFVRSVKETPKTASLRSIET